MSVNYSQNIECSSCKLVVSVHFMDTSEIPTSKTKCHGTDHNLGHPGLLGVLRHSVQLQTLPQDTLLRHPGLPGVLRHSVKLQTLPQDTSLIERVENKRYYSDLAVMMTSPTQCSM
jgi:hypothetical protein